MWTNSSFPGQYKRPRKKKGAKITVRWATEVNDRERPFIQSYEVKPQKNRF